MMALSDIVSKANVYIASNRETNFVPALKEIARWVTRIVNIFGLDSTPYVGDKIGWNNTNSDGTEASNKEEILMPYLRVLSTFRDRIRAQAIASQTKQVPSQDLLTLCDILRDDELPPLGVSLDDRDSATALVKIAPAEELLAIKAEKDRKAAEKEATQSAARKQREEIERKKLDQGKISPAEMFKPPHCYDYEAWDETGLPTKVKGGEEVTKSRGKKLKKDQARQEAARKKWIAANTL